MARPGLIVTVVGAVVAVLLQAILAPFMVIGAAVPNFILAFVIANAVARPTGGIVAPFVLGLLYDLMGNGPVGAMALVCVVLSFVCSRLLMMLNNDTLFIPIVLIVAGTLLGNVIYGILVIACGMDVSVTEALVGRVLPCGLYDAVLALVMFPLLARLGALDGAPLRME